MRLIQASALNTTLHEHHHQIIQAA